MKDSIEKSIEIKASVDRIWRALTNHREFGEWFRVNLDGPFAVGEVTRGVLTYPGYENLKWEVMIEAMEPERLFSFTWHPHAVDPTIDYSSEPPTLVEFRLEPIPAGTRLTVTESGFSALPKVRWTDALRSNEGGWEQQMLSIQAYAEQP